MIANRLKFLRTARKIKQSDLAKILSVSQSTVSGWESGRYEIDNCNLCKIADFFDVSIDYLLHHTDNPQSLNSNATDLSKVLSKDNIYFENNRISKDDKDLIRTILKRIFSN